MAHSEHVTGLRSFRAGQLCYLREAACFCRVAYDKKIRAYRIVGDTLTDNIGIKAHDLVMIVDLGLIELNFGGNQGIRYDPIPIVLWEKFLLSIDPGYLIKAWNKSVQK